MKFYLSEEIREFSFSLEKTLSKSNFRQEAHGEINSLRVHALMKKMDLHALLPLDDERVSWAEEIMLVSQLLGRHSANQEFSESVVLCGEILRCSPIQPHHSHWLRSLRNGDLSFSFAPRSRADVRFLYSPFEVEGGTCRLQPKGCMTPMLLEAQMLLIPCETQGGERRIFVIDVHGLDLAIERSIDGNLWGQIQNHYLDIPLKDSFPVENGARNAIDRAYNMVRLSISAESLGISERLFDLCVDHLSLRRQFGSVLATYQSLRHKMADMKISIELMKSLVQVAAAHTSTYDSEALHKATRFFVDTRAREIAEAAIQLHGGMGMTEECSVGTHARRLLVLGHRFESGVDALEQVCDELGEAA